MEISLSNNSAFIKYRDDIDYNFGLRRLSNLSILSDIEIISILKGIAPHIRLRLAKGMESERLRKIVEVNFPEDMI